jgi:hypothetical protein
LRYVELHFDGSPIETEEWNDRSVTSVHHRCVILDQLRQCAPSLECLTLWWHDVQLLFECSILPWSSIQKLNIRLRIHEKDNPSASLLVRLPTIKAFPELRYLSFGSRRFDLTPPEFAAEQILSWLDALVSSSSKFVILHVNRLCPYFRPRISSTSRDMLIMLLQQHIHLKNYRHSSANVIIDSNEEVIIWL